MLCIGKISEFPKKQLLAVDKSNGNGVFYTPTQTGCLPQQTTTECAFDIVPDEWFFKLIKKYSLNKIQISDMRDFYRQNQQTTLDISDFKLLAAYKELEGKILNILKKHYCADEGKIEPYFDGKSQSQNVTGSFAVLGGSNSGKSYFVSEVLIRPEYQDTFVYIFSMHPKDPSLQRIREHRKNKKNHFY